ncbi:MAG TPA: ABC transporter permease subunit [Caulobacteraceae bacterium]|nr:ABC transporter permease subunit [Caulobacteraceae bacterium]
MLGKVAAFEFRQQIRSPLFWAVVGLFFLLTFGYMASDNISIGDTANVHKNSPFAIIQINLIMGLFFMFASTAFVAGAVLRDDDTGFGPILRAAPLSKFDYLYGRFLGAFAVAILAFLGVTAGLMVGSLIPGLDPEKLGPFRPAVYAFAVAVMAGPMLLMSSAVFFLLATTTRSMASVFVAMIVFVVAYILSGIALGKPDIEPLAAPWDPIGLFAFDVATRYWTANDRNTLLPALTGALLFNRIFCVGLGLGALALALPLYRHDAAPGRASRRPVAAPVGGRTGSRAPALRPRFDRAAIFAQFLARTRFDMAQVFKSPVFWILLGLGLANAGGYLWSLADDGRYGGALWPVTRLLIPGLDGSFTAFVVIIAAFYSGELVWRDRERRTHEIIEAAPSPDWTFIVPKTAAVILVLAATLVVGVLAAILVQTLKGYHHYELGKYLLWYLIPGVVDLSILAALAVFGQVIAPNKYVGWGVMALYIIATFALPSNGFEHNLYIFGGTNPVPLSDMNGQGKFWIGAWWFRLYWGAFSLALLVAAYALWRRGASSGPGARFRRAAARLRGPAGWLGAAAVVIFIAAGIYIYQNTNVLNPYRTGPGDDRWMADYEKALLPYEKVPQPDVVAVRLAVTLDPHAPALDTRGVYVLENHTDQPLREVHVRFDRDLDVRALSVQGAWPKRTFERFNYRIFAFDTPMAPGERRTLSFETRLAERGFRTSRRRTRDLTSVVDNGTFVNSFQFAPIIGMDRALLLVDRGKRRKYGLPAALHPAPLGDQASRARNYASRAGWATSDITITTPADQVPMAPGREVSDDVKNGLRTARFVTERPILQFFSIQSARYAVKSEVYRGVKLSVYYDPRHSANVTRMLRALRVSLDYYQTNFSPYQFDQARIVEFPDYAQFAQSFAGTFPWSEGLGFIADYRDPTRIDLVSYVAAHEFAHQWWAHQLIGADQQGATVLSETLAQYSALRVMRRLYGPDQIRKFLKFELDSYLRARGGEAAEEMPLEKVENQGYIHYRKGSLVMYRLADEIGEDAVNRALRTLLAKYAFKGAPYPTALDLVAALRAQAPPDKQALITDLFEKITLYDLEAGKAQATRRPDGRYDVSFTFRAEKRYANGAGRETPAPMNETVDVGLFTAKPGDRGFGSDKVLYLGKRPVASGAHTLRFVTAVKPRFAGIDPYNELIDRNSDDNIIPVS